MNQIIIVLHIPPKHIAVYLLNALKLCPSTIHNNHLWMGRTHFLGLGLFTWWIL